MMPARLLPPGADFGFGVSDWGLGFRVSQRVLRASASERVWDLRLRVRAGGVN